MATTIVSVTIYMMAIMMLGLHVYHCLIDARMKREHNEIIRRRDALEFIRIQQVRNTFDNNTIK